MPKIDVDAVLAAKAPRIARWVPGFVIRWLKRTIHQDEINYILEEYSALPPQQFIQACFKFWGVTYSVEGLEKLDPKGRYLFASNHPFGGMDGMMLADELVGYFGDARVIVNDLLMHVEPLRPLWIPVNKHGSQCGEYLRRFDEAFASDCPILTFPAGLCSRRRQGVVSDLPWRSNFVKRASSSERRIVPVFVEGELSDFFYRLSNFRTKDRDPVQYRDALSARRDVFAEGKTFPDTGRGSYFDGRAGRMRIVAAAGGLRTRKGVFFGKKVACRSKTRINCLVLL